ncbi:Gfo/Idh/MocA family protein [Streptomyces botrytidirepellens]|uniref:Gfo/Idh/MocA family oxidoreductase n=1 Tax=Streptomyces botrytidirepellens TaxID=2486417 RepID=A0A3M8WRE8_9ACTN|nr:Gfo/Idh/MocA family oxidoreductase [Streptomyces botrytidirepellens]RNG31579.1 gfo/Idh/MocA family oxidoreductase [Streptomyces botrytidirepellens]
MASQSHRIGILGSGNIFGRYVTGLARYPELEIVRVGDIDPARAKQAAADHGIPAWGDDAELYADASVDIIVNLTPPVHHARTIITALESGKHVYVEKPLATTVEEGRAVLEAAARSGRLLGSAPDTFLGSASQTARKAIDDGLIGAPIGASAFIGHSKAETWHPDPRFLFQPGGGPVMDMGPYYVAILVNCLGPIQAISAASRIGAPHRAVTAPGRAVDSIEVTVPTHTAAVLTFASGVLGTAQMSFDVWDSDLPFMEIYGTEGTLSLGNPNHFDGEVRLKRHGDAEWSVLEPVVGLFGAVGTKEQARRGLGVRDLADAVEGDPHRATGSFAFHVLEALCAVEEASQEARVVHLTSTCERPQPRYPA